jgi:hypothetical protein
MQNPPLCSSTKNIFYFLLPVIVMYNFPWKTILSAFLWRPNDSKREFFSYSPSHADSSTVCSSYLDNTWWDRRRWTGNPCPVRGSVFGTAWQLCCTWVSGLAGRSRPPTHSQRQSSLPRILNTVSICCQRIKWSCKLYLEGKVYLRHFYKKQII